MRAHLPALLRRRKGQLRRDQCRREASALPPQGLADFQILRRPEGEAADARRGRRRGEREDITARRFRPVVNLHFRHGAPSLSADRRGRQNPRTSARRGRRTESGSELALAHRRAGRRDRGDRRNAAASAARCARTPPSHEARADRLLRRVFHHGQRLRRDDFRRLRGGRRRLRRDLRDRRVVDRRMVDGDRRRGEEPAERRSEFRALGVAQRRRARDNQDGGKRGDKSQRA